jgi:8-oxo-dGTP diphosphatase
MKTDPTPPPAGGEDASSDRGLSPRLPPGAVPRTVEAIDWRLWKPVDRAVLCFIRQGDRLLLIRKKRGLGAGKINGPGGRIDPGENAEQAAVRETEEEIGVTPLGIRRSGELSFQFRDGYSLHCTVFLTDRHRGEPVETGEALPFWCPTDRVPFDQMWADDRLWFPLLLAGVPFQGVFIFDGDAMLSYRLNPDR